MNEFRGQVVLPVGAAVLAAAVAYGVNTMFGPQPRAWLFEYGTVLFYVPWLVALSLISACATLWQDARGRAPVHKRFPLPRRAPAALCSWTGEHGEIGLARAQTAAASHLCCVLRWARYQVTLQF
jgi:hypothetical protein